MAPYQNDLCHVATHKVLPSLMIYPKGNINVTKSGLIACTYLATHNSTCGCDICFKFICIID